MAQRLYRDRYEPLALAGRGAQGEVWKARDHVHDRTVALKIREATPGGREALLTEARTLLDMRPHEGLPLVRDDFFVDDRYVIVMDWIEGQDLDRTAPLPFAEAIERLEAVARALDHLHGHAPPIVHRDIKPSNIVVTSEGRTVLVDFGLSGPKSASYLTGTPAFVAPETQAGDTGPASDIFSLAVTATVLLTGTLPEPGREPDWSSIPEGHRDRVRQGLGAGLSVDPQMRPHSASTFVASLKPPTAPNNLPASLSSFVGRASATRELRRLVGTGRLVTLVGPGGCGKTRLALAVADAALSDLPGGVWVAELAGVTDAELVTSRVAVALGVQTRNVRDQLEALTTFLDGDRTLLVLDNCEHVILAAAHLAEALLRACPKLTILATSREPLRATGETVWNVPPLDRDEAATLFEHRVPPGVKLRPEDAELVSEVCRRLDGIPLALELAAAQLSTIRLEELNAALDVALGVLTGGARTNPRQETMRATIKWSHDQLAVDERAAFRRLSVFAGGFTPDAADVVSGATPFLHALVERSLVNDEGDRLRLLEPIRQFAVAELDAAGESAAIATAHASWIEGFTEMEGPITREWLDRVSAEHDNLEAALSYTITDDPATAGRIVRNAVLYWTHGGYWVDGRRWVDRALGSEALDAPVRAELLNRAGDMARNQGDLLDGRRLLEEAVALYRDLGDKRGLAMALLGLGLAAHALGDLAASRNHQLESIALHRESGERRGLAMALSNLGLVHDALGEIDEAMASFAEALAILREEGGGLSASYVLLNLAAMRRKANDSQTARREYEEALSELTEARQDYGTTIALNELASLDLADGDVETARSRAEESLEISRRQNDKSSQASSLHVLGGVAHAEGDLPRASARHADALAINREIGAPLDIASSLELAGVLDAAMGKHADAVRRFGEAHALREASDVSTPAGGDVERAILAARKELGDDAFEEQWNLGRASVAR